MIRFKDFITMVDEAKLVRVNRVRDGKIQKRVPVTPTPGYKIENGKLEKMSFQEIRHRKLSQIKAARKRRTKMAQILRKRAVSLKRRKALRLK